MDNDFQKLFPYFEQNKKFTYLDSANTSQILGSCLSSMIKYILITITILEELPIAALVGLNN